LRGKKRTCPGVEEKEKGEGGKVAEDQSFPLLRSGRRRDVSSNGERKGTTRWSLPAVNQQKGRGQPSPLSQEKKRKG